MSLVFLLIGKNIWPLLAKSLMYLLRKAFETFHDQLKHHVS